MPPPRPMPTTTPPPRVVLPTTPGTGAPAVVPALEGATGAEAVGRLVTAGLRANVVTDRDPRATLGRVRTQTPRAGTSARRGDSVTLTVGAGFSPYSIDVPNVVGQRLNDATARLSTVGAVASVVRVPGSGSPDVVLAQYPVGIFVREEARGVTLWVGGP
jgi:beta-lactam-binding protein with PASTA domain